MLSTRQWRTSRDSYQAMMSAFYMCEHYDPENRFDQIDGVVSHEDFIGHAYDVAMFIVDMYTSDPHKSVSSLARKVIQYIQHQRPDNAPEVSFGDYWEWNVSNTRSK